jgi:Nucleotidyl transferase AbiEii toxin, Type IV TA system
VYGFTRVPFSVDSRWFNGKSEIHSYELDELLGTKMRALFQRRQGRDLFDLATALKNEATNPERVVAALLEYMRRDGRRLVTRAQFEKDMVHKLRDPEFAADIGPLLAAGFAWNIEAATSMVSSELIERLPRAAWKGETSVKQPRKRRH